MEAEIAAPRPEAIKAVPVRHPWRYVAAVLIAIFVANAIWVIATQANFEWSVVGDYVFSSPIIDGARNTLILTAIAMAMGIVLGVVLAVMWLSPNPLISGTSWFYIWIFRGTPVVVQLLLWFFIAAVFPHVSIGIPFGGPEIFGGSSKDLITPWMAAIFGFGFNEAAYMAEIVRAGINSVDEGQEEAACALGLSRMQTMRRIILPQAMRVIIPPTGNETISMLKTTSIAIVIAFPELTYAVTQVYSRTYKTIEMLIVACIWYLFFTTILTIVQYYIEKKYARGSRRTMPESKLEYFAKHVLPMRSPREEGGPPVLPIRHEEE
ncbi:MAG: amino acid ABC transporter permease [Solirubrobacterales bacterium]